MPLPGVLPPKKETQSALKSTYRRKAAACKMGGTRGNAKVPGTSRKIHIFLTRFPLEND